MEITRNAILTYGKSLHNPQNYLGWSISPPKL